MPIFNYTAIDASGNECSGSIESDTEKSARSALKQKKLTPLSLVNSYSGGKKKTFLQKMFVKKISIEDLASITRQISTLVDAGLPIAECLRAVGKQLGKSYIASLIMSVQSKVVEGRNLADSMAEYPNVFDNLYVSLVRSGEKSGTLGPTLSRLADYTENSQKIKSKIIQSLMYPIVLTCVAFSVVGILLVTVVPQVIDSLSSMDQGVPFATQVLISISDFLIDHGLKLIMLIVGIFFSFKFLMQDPNFVKKIDIFLLRLPVVNSIIMTLNCSRFAKTLSILLSSSVPLVEAMSISSNVLTNSAIKRDVEKAASEVKEGNQLYQSLSKSSYFPSMMLYMIASGEKSGSLDDMLLRSANNEEKDFEAKINIALGIFEPLLVIVMAGAVLFIIMAIMLPIMKMSEGF